MDSIEIAPNISMPTRTSCHLNHPPSNQDNVSTKRSVFRRPKSNRSPFTHTTDLKARESDLFMLPRGEDTVSSIKSTSRIHRHRKKPFGRYSQHSNCKGDQYLFLLSFALTVLLKRHLGFLRRIIIMGKVAFFRIRNCSSKPVIIYLEDCRNVDGLPDEVGVLVPGGMFPTESPHELFPGQFFHRIEGEPTRRIHKDGYFHIAAKTDGAVDAESVRVAVDHSNWWSDRNHNHEGEGHECVEGGLALCVDVDDDDEEPRLKQAFKIEVRIYDAIPTADWMKHMANKLSSKPLCQVAIPGTHDSATYKWNKELGASPDNDVTSSLQDKLEFGRGIIRKIGSKLTDGILHIIYERLCKCQDMSILQQLKSGIRYLDLRVALAPDGTFYTCHGVFCVALTEVFQEVTEFLQDHSHEIILLDFNHFYGMDKEHHAEFATLLTETFGNKIATQPALNPSSTVQEYWDAGAKIVIAYHDIPTKQASNGKLWHKSLMLSPWPNKNKPQELREKLEANVKSRNISKFFVLQGILTPDGDLIKSEILESKGNTSVKSIASRVSGKVVGWVGDEWQEENHNVVIVDFFQDCSMVPAILSLNK